MNVKRQRGEIGAGLTLRDVPSRIAKEIVSGCCFQNPVWLTARKFSRTGFVSSAINQYLTFAWQFEDELMMTRGAYSFLGERLRGFINKVVWKNCRIFRPVVFPKLRIDLVREQEKLLSDLENVLRTGKRPFGNFLFIASTAVGKTILQATVAALLGQRTLVLCPTDLIMRAWYEDLYKAFKFTSKDVGLIKQKKWVEGKHFTLASIQTLGRRRDRWEDINDSFGTIVLDEVQGVTADTLFDFLSQSPAAYHVGATATAEARSGDVNLHLQALFGNSVSEVHTYHKETQTSMKISEVKVVKTTFRYEHARDNLDWHDLSVELTANEERNKQIIDNVKKEWLDGRVVLVVTKRREHVDVLYTMAEEAGITNANKITGDTNTNKFYTQKLLGLIRSRKVTCIFATMQAIKVGANVPALDSLHIAMPPANKRDFEQLLGRIRRKTDGKKEATMTYYYDVKTVYFMLLFKRIVVPVFRKMRIEGYENLYIT